MAEARSPLPPPSSVPSGGCCVGDTCLDLGGLVLETLLLSAFFLDLDLVVTEVLQYLGQAEDKKRPDTDRDPDPCSNQITHILSINVFSG